MIFKQLQTQFGAAQAVTKEFVTLLDATFTGYRNIANHLFASLPTHLKQGELLALIDGELKSRLFDQTFCEAVPQALKNLRRAMIRLEDLVAAQPGLPKYVNNLERLAAIAERVEALYQRHWETYRYQAGMSEQDVLEFLLQVFKTGGHWDAYLESFHDKEALVQAMHGRPAPEDMASLRVSYHRDGAAHFSVGTLKDLTNFLESGYRFVCAIYELDPQTQPLSLLHIEVADPVELFLALPAQAESAYRRFLQYLFLKDMLKREALLKFVFEAVEKEHGRAKTLAQPQIAAFLKDLTANVKALPSDGRFTISDRTFPNDEVQVLQEFVVTLEQQHIPYDAMVGTERKRSAASKATPKAAPAPATPPATPQPPPHAPTPAPRPDANHDPRHDPTKPRDHIRILTDTSVRS